MATLLDDLVAGASGALGIEICRRLRARDSSVRALVRADSDVGELSRLGVQLALGDLTDRASLAAACHDVESLVSAATGLMSRTCRDSIESVDRAGQIALADAARAAGVRHMVTISSSGKITDAAPLIAAKRAVERHLDAIALPHTNLRGGYFMDFWLGPPSGFDLASGSVRVLGSGTRACTWIAREDVAEFAVLAALECSPESATLELAGPQALSQLDVVRMAEEIGGRPIHVTHVGHDELRALRAAARTPVETTVAELVLRVAGGDTVEMTDALTRFPVSRTPVRDYVRRTLNRALQVSER